VFRFAPQDSRLGQRLQRSHYRLVDGSEPGARGGVFSGLAVRALSLPTTMPAPRGRGVRDTMTPFVERSG
jgi:hypothetical protein